MASSREEREAMTNWGFVVEECRGFLADERVSDQERVALDRLITEAESGKHSWSLPSHGILWSIRFRLRRLEATEEIEVQIVCPVCGCRVDTVVCKREDAWRYGREVCDACRDDLSRTNPDPREWQFCRLCGDDLPRSFFDDERDFEYGLCAKCKQVADDECKLGECDGCHELVLEEDLGSVLVRRQTHWEPAEYDDICTECQERARDYDPY